MKPKVLVLLGAGSSIELGLPSIRDISVFLLRTSRQWAEREKHPDFFRKLWGNRLAYVRGWTRVGKEFRSPDYERCLGDMIALWNGLQIPPLGDPIGQWMRRADCFSGVALGWPKSGIGFFVQDQYEAMVRELTRCFRQKCIGFEARRVTSPCWPDYCDLLETLQDSFALGVYNLNHDTAAYAALQNPNPFTGFDADGRFQPAQVHARRKWDFLYHLHGSVHFGIRNDRDDGRTVIWRPDLEWRKDLEDIAYTGHSTEDRLRVPYGSLVTGGWKAEQIQAEPYQTYYSTLTRHAHAADAVLICGYGFGDVHVNSVLANLLQARDASRPPVLVIDYDMGRGDGTPQFTEDGDHRPLSERSDRWALALQRTLRFEKHKLVICDQLCRTAPRVTKLLLKRDQYEVIAAGGGAPEANVAVWFGGMSAAAKRKAEIVDWLKRSTG